MKVLQVILINLLLGIGEAPQFTHYPKQAILAPLILRTHYTKAKFLLIVRFLKTQGTSIRWVRLQVAFAKRQ